MVNQPRQRTTPTPTSRGSGHSLGLTVLAVGALVMAGAAGPAGAQVNHTLHDDGWILAAARQPGLQGSIWRTDLWMRTPSWSGATVTFYFCEAGEDNTDVPGHEVVFEDGKGLYFEDVVDELLGVGDEPWLGAIHYVANRSVYAYARVYSISADGAASYGQLIEGIPTADMSMAFDDPDYPGTVEDQWMAAVKHTADGRFRVNVGVVNPTAVEGQFYVQIFDETGNTPPGGTDNYLISVPPYSMVQLSDPFAEVNGGEWNRYEIRVEASTPGTGAFGYASVVDNATNDAFFVRGIKRFRADAD